MGRLPDLVLTIGHSNRSAEDFLNLLEAHQVKRLADVRKMPRSRANPQFNFDALANTLGEHDIEYTAMPDLGGLRRPQPDSPNTGWKNKSFQAFADFMLTPAFEANVEELIALAASRRTAIMCAEAVPWRCHRSLIADALVVRGIEVAHIMTATRLQPHVLHSWARVEGTRITYPPEAETPDPQSRLF